MISIFTKIGKPKIKLDSKAKKQLAEGVDILERINIILESTWTKLRPMKWKHEDGWVIIKYRMTSTDVEFLLYRNNDEIEYGDFRSFASLKLAKLGIKSH